MSRLRIPGHAARARLAIAITALLFSTGPTVAGAASALLVTVADVTATTAVIWARSGTPDAVTVELQRAGTAERHQATLTPSPDRDFTGRLRVTGLFPGTPYRYRVRAGDVAVDGTFSTAPHPDEETALRLVWSADLGSRGFCRRLGIGYRIFDAMTARAPDVFLFVGDTIYADHRCRGEDVVPGADFIARTLPEFHARHRYNREDPPLQRFLARTPVWATWDDHEVRNNFAGPHEPLMPVGRQAFIDYWGIDTPADDPTRLYRRFRYGRLAEVFLLDTRQYRDRNCRPDGPEKTMLGAPQRRWLIDAVRASTAVWKLVVSSVSLSIPKAWPCGDSWAPHHLLFFRTGFATERGTILSELAAHGVTNLVVLAGDVHFASLMEHRLAGWRFHEFTAGPLAASLPPLRPPGRGLDSQVLATAGNVFNFGELEITSEALSVRILDQDGHPLASARLRPVTDPR